MYKKCFAEFKGTNQHNIHLWDDKIGYIPPDPENPWINHAYREDDDGKFKGLNGERLIKTRKWKTKEYDLHFHDMRAHQKYLIERYGNDDTVSTGHRELFFDIECEMLPAMTEWHIKQAAKTITSIAWWDKQVDHWTILILDREGKLKEKFRKNPETKEIKEIIPFRNEGSLLMKFIERFREIDPDILIGYNSDYFDIPYLYYRIQEVCGREWAQQLSPISGARGAIQLKPDTNESRPQNNFWFDDSIYVKIAGIESLDYWKMHKKYHFRDEPSWKLDAIGEKYVGLGKVEYEGNLDKLFETDIEKFIEYNFRDVEILKELDKKLKYIELTKNLAHKGKINYSEIYASSKIHDGDVSSYLYDHGITPPARDREAMKIANYRRKNNIKTSYPGGYTFCPEAGLHERNFDLDLTSLYPSIIETLNIGRETLIGQIVFGENIGEDDKGNPIYGNFTPDKKGRLGLNDLKKIEKEGIINPLFIKDPKSIKLKKKHDKYYVDAEYIETDVDKIIEIIEENNLAISSNGVLFNTENKSVLAVIIAKWKKERAEYKKRMKEAFKSGNNELGEEFHIKQYTMKILLNSLYGATSLPSFRYGNVMMTEAITLTGQRIIQESAWSVNKHINKVTKGEESIKLKDGTVLKGSPEIWEIINKERGETNRKILHNIPTYICKEGDRNFCLYMDTDSVYFDAESILKYLYPNYDSFSDKEKDNLCEEVALFYQNYVTTSYTILAKETLNMDGKFLEMKTEAINRTTYTRETRRYAQWITKSEGRDVDTMDIKGLEYQKSNFPPILGTFFDKLLRQVIRGATKKEIDEQVVEFKKELLEMDINKLGTPTRVKTLNNYIMREPVAGEMFSIIGKGAPAAVKAAIRYNDFIRFWKLDKKYSYIVQGDQVKWIYLKPNPYRMEALAFLSYEMPPQIKTNLFDKYVDKNKVYESVLKNKIEGFFSDLNWVLEDSVEKNNFSLFFAKDLAS